MLHTNEEALDSGPCMKDCRQIGYPSDQGVFYAAGDRACHPSRAEVLLPIPGVQCTDDCQ